MSLTLQEFFADATRKAAADLAEALLRLPEDRRGWSAGGGARTALDQVAECALLAGYTAALIQTRTWSTSDLSEYASRSEALIAAGWNAMHTLLMENTEKHAAALRALPDNALSEEIEIPSGKQTVAELIAYPYWNMTYHLGQINYIAALPEVSEREKAG